MLLTRSRCLLFAVLLTCSFQGMGAPLTPILSDPTANSANPSAISIYANQQQINMAKNEISFSGNVIIKKEGLQISADTVTVTNLSHNSSIMTAYGAPAHFKQAMPDEHKNITGNSLKIIYNIGKNRVTLEGDAQIVQQNNHISGNLIIYDTLTKQVNAQSKEHRRVKTIIVPNEVKG